MKRARLFSLVALVAPLMLVGCSRITTSEVAQRELGTIALASGLRVTVRAMHHRTQTSAGLTGAGRGFTYQDATESHHLELGLGATLAGGRPLESALGSRDCSTADDCKAQLASASATLCESQGELVAIVGKRRWVLFAYGGEVFETSIKDDATACEETARHLPPVVDRIAAAPQGRGCSALFAAKEARATTRCMLRLGSTSSLAAEGLASRIDAAIAGVADEDLQVRWVAAIGRGAKGEPDYEQALYEQLLLANDEASSAAARLALAYAPSRARRVQFLTQVEARCRDHTLPRFDQLVAGIAAGLLADPALSERVARACEVPTPAPEPWHPSHLK